jgi:trehalose 6-phosphate phosphatase
MRYVLARANRDALERFVCSRVLLAFDYDGTLAPIVDDPERATMRTTTRALLRQIARRFPCVVISGRARADALRRLRGVGAVEVVGNHGIEPWQISQPGRLAVRRWQPTLARRLARFPGVRIENKVFSVAVHYREAREKQKALIAIRRTAYGLGGIRLIRGKQVVNLIPRGAPHKGIALEKARVRFGCDTAIYVGDDVTDEDVFGLDEPDRLLTIRVGRKRDSLASYFLWDQGEIDDFLGALLSVAPERTHRPVRRVQQ